MLGAPSTTKGGNECCTAAQRHILGGLEWSRDERALEGLSLCCSGILGDSNPNKNLTHVNEPKNKLMNQFKKKTDKSSCHAQGRKSYRAVEHALAIHGNVEATLDSLDGHHSQTHGNKIKQGCIGAGSGKGDRENRRQIEDRMGRSSFCLTLVDTAVV